MVSVTTPSLLSLHQAQSICTQEDVDEWIPYMMPKILNQMESKFVKSLDIIAIRKALLKHDNTLQTWKPLFIHHNTEIERYSQLLTDMNEKIVNLQRTPGPTGAPGKVIHPKYYIHLKKGAHQSHLGKQKMD